MDLDIQTLADDIDDIAGRFNFILTSEPELDDMTEDFIVFTIEDVHHHFAFEIGLGLNGKIAGIIPMFLIGDDEAFYENIFDDLIKILTNAKKFVKTLTKGIKVSQYRVYTD